MKVVGLRGLWLGVFLVACATSPASSPQPVPGSTTRSVPAALTVPIDPESESVVQKLAAKVGLGSEREEIIEFTRAAQAIEAERNDGMEFYASLMERVGPIGARPIMNRTMLDGTTLEEAGRYGAPGRFEGMYFLHRRLLLLDVPQVLEPVKDSLVQAYTSEIQLAIDQSQSSDVEAAIDGAVYNAVTKIHPTINYYGVDTNLATFVYPRVSKNNLDTWKRKAEQYERYSGGYRTYMRYVEGPWGQTQLFRRWIYTRWAEILQEQGIAAAEEEFMELIPGLMSDMMQEVMKGLSPEHQKELAERHRDP